MASTTKSAAAVGLVMALVEAIRELGSVPSGHLYARVMGHLTLEQYTQIVETLKQAGLVREERSHLLRWIGPEMTHGTGERTPPNP